jgi:HAD superfamily hydrolase (TIGR01490 family)
METIFSEDSITGKKNIVFFDLDRTIINAISGNALVRIAYKKGIMTNCDLARAFYLSVVYKLNLRDPQLIIDEMVSWAKGMQVETMNDLCTEVLREVLVPSVYKEAVAEIKIRKNNNAKLVILSSALTPICRGMAKHLEMDDIICSELEVTNGILTGSPIGHLCFGIEKAARLKEYCEKNNTNTSEAWYYGDSISDLAALKSVGNPVCVNPDRKLRKEAIQRGWKILWWN